MFLFLKTTNKLDFSCLFLCFWFEVDSCAKTGPQCKIVLVLLLRLIVSTLSIVFDACWPLSSPPLAPPSLRPEPPSKIPVALSAPPPAASLHQSRAASVDHMTCLWLRKIEENLPYSTQRQHRGRQRHSKPHTQAENQEAGVAKEPGKQIFWCALQTLLDIFASGLLCKKYRKVERWMDLIWWIACCCGFLRTRQYFSVR